MEFVQGLPKGVYVGQTRIEHAQAIATSNQNLTGFNLALHVNDDPQRVQQHRMILLNELSAYGVDKITWMTQTHSTICHTVNEQIPFVALEGDALVTQRRGHALMMMTADCLPVVLGNADGTEVANLHAGWRGLASGIIENTIVEMKSQPAWAWLGAAISQPCFEIGEEVKQAFCEKYPELEISYQGRQAEAKESGQSLMTSFILVLAILYIMLAIPFASYTQPLIIMLAIPFGIVGAFLGHLLLGYSLSMISIMGIVALCGVVVNDTLVMVDYANQMRKEGHKPYEAIVLAATRRFRPIFLTTATTFGGLAPMIYETSIQAKFMIPMAISLGYGILFSTVISLIFVPAMYLMLEDVKSLFQKAD